jgi:hypothetical protein
LALTILQVARERKRGSGGVVVPYFIPSINNLKFKSFMLKFSFLLRLEFFAWWVMFGRVPRCCTRMPFMHLRAGSCLHISYPHHPGGVAQNGERSHVVP